MAYTYDARGNPVATTGTLASTLGKDNPLRYRGYHYDSETGFYYLQSRYYDPGIGRMVNADTVSVIDVQKDFFDKNLYAYCDNNPVVRMDKDGKLWDTVFDVISLGVTKTSRSGDGGTDEPDTGATFSGACRPVHSTHERPLRPGVEPPCE